ncbi:hypothetical protein BXZ70DRAFT_730992 [Cristinia sonorae]|uniref:Uncharacterized protein n=1 Tax=Cristinia sonorae TaxID=1940300 RepID=A0A8K0UVF3_9AGAR|nr:hypothetical protein BXZ70DRAFT_730992 [Cristinia sonorae]
MSFWHENTREARLQKIEVYRVVTYFIAGVFLREMIFALRYDWNLIRGRKHTGIPIAVLYFLCRHITTASLFTGLASRTRPVTGFSVEVMSVLAHVKQGLTLMGHVLAYQILVVRVVAIWRHMVVGWFLYIVMLVLWILNLYASTQIKGAYENSHLTLGIGLTMSTLNSSLLILCIVGLIRAHRNEDFPTAQPTDGYRGQSTLYMLYSEGAYYFVIVWCFQISITTIDLVNFDPQRSILGVFGTVVLAVFSMCACRVHQDMVNRSKISPMAHTPSLPLTIATLVQDHRDDSVSIRSASIPPSHLQLLQAPSNFSRLTSSTSWRTTPTADSIELGMVVHHRVGT